MGAFGFIFAGAGIGSKSIFFIGLTIVSLAVVFTFFRESKSLEKRKILRGEGQNGGFSMLSPEEKYGHIAMAAFNEDTDPSAQRRNVIHMMANGSTDTDHLFNRIGEITSQLSSDQQVGAPLHQLLHERASGQIGPSDYRNRLSNYVMQLAHEHDVQLQTQQNVTTNTYP